MNELEETLHRTWVQLLLDNNFKEVAAVAVDTEVHILPADYPEAIAFDVPTSFYGDVNRNDRVKQVMQRAILAVSQGRIYTEDGYEVGKDRLSFRYRVKPIEVEQGWQDTVRGLIANAVETSIRTYLNAERFRQTYPLAFQKWVNAESALWGRDSEQQITTIGHLCREAMQEFATALVEQYQPPGVDKDKANDVARIRAVLYQRPSQLGKSEKPFLDALLAYWGTVSDLVQRQEHGGKKEGEPLTREDARRIVFHTTIVMFEIDKALSRMH